MHLYVEGRGRKEREGAQLGREENRRTSRGRTERVLFTGKPRCHDAKEKRAQRKDEVAGGDAAVEPRKEGEGPPPWPLRSASRRVRALDTGGRVVGLHRASGARPMPGGGRGGPRPLCRLPRPRSGGGKDRCSPGLCSGPARLQDGRPARRRAVQVLPTAPRMDRRGGHSRAGRQSVARAGDGRDASPLPHSSIQPVVRIGVHLGVFLYTLCYHLIGLVPTAPALVLESPVTDPIPVRRCFWFSSSCLPPWDPTHSCLFPAPGISAVPPRIPGTSYWSKNWALGVILAA